MRRGTLLSKPASGRATVDRERDLRFDRRSTRGSAVRVDRRRSERSRSVKIGDVPFLTVPSVAAIVATCRLFRVDRRSAFAASLCRLGPKYPFIPNGLRFDLSTAFRRGSVRFVAPTARPPNEPIFRRKRRRWKTLQNVENAARAFATRVDKETCDRERKGGRLDFDATTRETLVPQVASRRGVKRSGGREGTRENRFV